MHITLHRSVKVSYLILYMGCGALRTFVGSSRRMRDVEIYSSRSVNQPFGRNHVLVCVGEGGIIKNVAMPIDKVSKPLEECVSVIFVAYVCRRHPLHQEEPSTNKIFDK